MDRLREFLDHLKQEDIAKGNLLGLLNVLIGRRIQTQDGTLVCSGVSWRVLAEVLKQVRWDRDEVQLLGIDPRKLAPRDRARFWYQVIAQLGVDSPAASKAGDALAEVLRGAGYEVGAAPGSARSGT
jgi:hypothetical protein